MVKIFDDKGFAKNHGLMTADELLNLSKEELINLIINLRIDVHNEQTNQRIACEICRPYYRPLSDLIPELESLTIAFGFDQGFGKKKAIGVICSDGDLLCAGVDFKNISGTMYWSLDKGIPSIAKWESDSDRKKREKLEWQQFLSENPNMSDIDSMLRPKFDDDDDESSLQESKGVIE